MSLLRYTGKKEKTNENNEMKVDDEGPGDDTYLIHAEGRGKESAKN